MSHQCSQHGETNSASNSSQGPSIIITITESGPDLCFLMHISAMQTSLHAQILLLIMEDAPVSLGATLFAVGKVLNHI